MPYKTWSERMAEWAVELFEAHKDVKPPIFPEGMTATQYAEIQKAYLIGTPDPANLNPAVVMAWWDEWGSMPMEPSERPQYFDGKDFDPDEDFPFDDQNDWEY